MSLSLSFIRKIALIIMFCIMSLMTISISSANSQYTFLNQTSNKADVKKFQNLFKELKIYNGTIDGNFQSIKKDLVTFQIKNKLIPNKNVFSAGYIGPITYKFLNTKYGSRFQTLYKKNFEIKQIKTIKKQAPNYNSYIFLDPGSHPSEIRQFQILFKELKIYKGKINGKFASIKPYIIKFQLKNRLIPNKRVYSAGFVGPITYKFLDKKYGSHFKTLYKKIFKFKKKKKSYTTHNNSNNYFVVTAYYSPLPGQKKYSYYTYRGRQRTFEEEKLLQGEGHTTASGKKVFSGIIAAPKSYSFGTKIQLEGLGVGVIEDRGGAIVRKGVRGHKYDRLDVWMGYGDTGLRKALKWGKRTVKGKILSRNAKVTMSFLNNKNSYTSKSSLIKNIGPNSHINHIKSMQSGFKKAGLYHGKIDGKYSSFKKAIIAFQIKSKIIKNSSSYGSGYIGKKTVSILEKKYLKYFKKIKKIEKKGVIKKSLSKKSVKKAKTLKGVKKEKKLKSAQVKKQKTIESTTVNFRVIEPDEIGKKLNISDKQKNKIKILIKKLKKKGTDKELKERIDHLIKDLKHKKLHNQLKYLNSLL